MRWVNRALVASVLVCAGCGNYSTEDLEFYAALPRREDLRVAVPADGTAGAATVCGALGADDEWLKAKPTSDGLNRGVGFFVGLIDVVRRYPPTWRGDDQRRWGPFVDDKHPDREVQVLITRTYPSPGAPVYSYQFQARPKGDGAFTTIIDGLFEGPSASRGKGSVSLFFQRFWDLGLNEWDTPHATAEAIYDRASDPVTISLDLQQEGFGVVGFRYEYVGYADGRGSFSYRFQDAAGNVLQASAAYDATGAGRSRVSFTRAGEITPIGYFDQCWDSSACLVYVYDPLNLTGTVVPPATEAGDLAQCVPVLNPPF